MQENDLIRLRHMLEAARDAVSFSAGRSREELLQDRILRLALVKCFEIIGEAAAKVSPELRADSPQIPWTEIIGMRNRLIHVYFDVDLDRLCDTISIDLPPLIAALQRIISAFEKAG
jgi:uncharacterized protein with HEPN domain